MTFSKFKNHLTAFFKSETGSTTAEYAVIAGFVSIVVVGAVAGLGDGVYNTMTNSANVVN
ncbi:MAG: Flp family type IVb pilin [Magnetovibrio sp.]|nr:Flp family type IVb pilin [Magnetovibrio sp.]